MRRAFTLVELLVSLGIGAVVCATAFVAVRAAGQAFAVGTRLAVENDLLRGGVCAALDELDTWRWYDDPPSATPLRGDGDPFAPLPVDEDLDLDFLPIRDPAASDDDYEVWWRRDSRCWWRGDPTSEDEFPGDRNLGDHSLFGTVDFTDGSALGGAERRWYHRLVRDVSHHLGYYALLDLAPPSLVASYFDEDGNVPAEFFDANRGGLGSIGTSWWDDRPHDFIALTLGGFYTVAVPGRAIDPRHRIPEINHAMFLTWLADGGAGVNPGWTADDAFDSVGGRLAVMPVAPAPWPSLSVTVRHYAANARQFHTGAVLLQSPVTGQDFKLRFSFSGTTLRGARRQRGLEPAAAARGRP